MMREKINAGIDITPYDPKKHFDYQYIYQVFANLWVINHIFNDNCRLVFIYLLLSACPDMNWDLQILLEHTWRDGSTQIYGI